MFVTPVTEEFFMGKTVEFVEEVEKADAVGGEVGHDGYLEP